MESIGVITKEMCAPLPGVWFGSVWSSEIVDLKPLNKCVLHVVHSIEKAKL